MYDRYSAIGTFYAKTRKILELHDLENLGEIRFSNGALSDALVGNYDQCAHELQVGLRLLLGGKLSEGHSFVDSPFIRTIELPNGGSINVYIVNQQSAEWYGREDAIAAFDFIYEGQRGVFEGCRTFLDLGGHQLVWSIFYAKTSASAKVMAFEPSVLNSIIGLFNCLINDVIDRIDVVPFAVAARPNVNAQDAIAVNEGEKMLVDFMTLPLRTCYLDEHVVGLQDFVKTDIEGYEFELLSDQKYCDLVNGAKTSHFELHLGHLVKRGIEVEDCVASLRHAGFGGTELYSSVEMYDFLKTCKRDGFYSFLI